MEITALPTGSPKHIHTAVDEQHFLHRSIGWASPLLLDLVDIAMAIHVADRVSVRPWKQRCHLELMLPLRHPEIFNEAHVKEKLKGILAWYTGDDWSLAFNHRNAPPRLIEEVSVFEFPSADTVEVALWSGGLDALAGFYYRFQAGSANSYVLFGTGSSDYISRKQRDVFAGLPKHVKQVSKLAQVPIRVQSATMALADHQLLRSRGFVFLMLGAVCALLEGQQELYVYENGIGAINLPFRAAEVGLDHARSVHPLSLRYMGELISAVLGETFNYRNPFLFSTKAQMCQALLDDCTLDLAYQTISCDRRHRDPEAVQCGRCSSCILRRQAFAALGVADGTPYVYSDFWFHGDVGPVHPGNHLPAMLYQVQGLQKALSLENPWQGLSQRYESLSFDVADQLLHDQAITDEFIQTRLVQLYQQYINEWSIIQNTMPHFAPV